MVSSIVLQVTLSNGLVVRWDGHTRVEILAQPRHFNKTCGLCGTFNKNQLDDFYTEAGM